jgi:hypothetical protein
MEAEIVHMLHGGWNSAPAQADMEAEIVHMLRFYVFLWFSFGSIYVFLLFFIVLINN